MDSNHGPLHYQCSALTTWATSPGREKNKLAKKTLTELLNDNNPLSNQVSRKEVFQPHLPVRLPCYDLAPVTSSTLNSALKATIFRYIQLPWLDGRCVQGPGTYSPCHCWYTITSDSSFMKSSCRLQSELRRTFRDWLTIAGSQPFVYAIVARV